MHTTNWIYWQQPLKNMGSKSSSDRDEHASGLLASEAPTHPLALRCDLVSRYPTHRGTEILSLGWILRGRIDFQAARVCGEGDRTVRLQIKVLYNKI